MPYQWLSTAKINESFESQILQNEWSKYRTLHLQRHQQREHDASERAAEVQQKIDEFTAQAKKVHDELDSMVDSARSKLVDLEVEVGHDVDRLSKKFEGKISDKTPEGQCLDVRAELTHCYNTLKDSGECQVFAQKLDQCVTKALDTSS